MENKKTLIIYSAIFLFLACLLVAVIVIPNVLAKPIEEHNHEYKIFVSQTIEGDKVYETRKCVCDETTKILMENYVAVTPTTVQNVLDNAVEGNVVILTAGEYGNLYLRKNDASVVLNNIGWAGGQPNTTFKREIKDLTIVGCEGAVVSSIVAEAGTYTPTINNNHSLAGEVDYLNMYIAFENLTIKNITFSPAANKCAVELASAGQKVSINGLTIEDCTVNGSGTISAGNRLFQSENQIATEYNSDDGKIFNADRKNITIKNNVLNNLHQGVKINFVENLVISGNKFNNIKGRDILMSGGNMSGTITISGNTSDGSTERFLRMSNLVGTLNLTNNVVINNTVFEVVGDKDIVKITGITGEVNIQGNTWNGYNDIDAKTEGVLNY